MASINVRISQRPYWSRKPKQNGSNHNNLITVRSRTSISTNNCHTNPIATGTYFPDKQRVPKILLTNVMSLVPKIDELREFLFRCEINVAFITETWLKELIPDSVIAIPGYTTFRRDRGKDNHGGICAYVNHNMDNYSQLNELNCCEDHEILWLRLRPRRLTRGFSCIIAAVIYHPPGADEKSIREHLFQSLTLAESKFPNCGLLITGDFNRLCITGLLNHFCLKQIVKLPTRNNATLDLILTNMHENYSMPKVYPPFGLSDHSTVVAFPRVKDKNLNKKN